MHEPTPFIYVLEKPSSNDNNLIVINAPEDILYVQHIKGNYTSIITRDEKTYYTTTNIFELDLILENFGFFFVARDVIVNPRKLKSYEPNFCKLYFTDFPDKESIFIDATRAVMKKIERMNLRVVEKQKADKKGFIWSYLSN